MTKKEDIKEENRLTTIENNVNTILTNHLPHLKDDIKEIKTETTKILWFLITSAFTLASGLVLIIIKMQ